MKNNLVSIILPNYNHAPFLKARLDSIFNQTYKNYEVILLDDCSSDNSLSILNKYKNHPKVSFFEVNKVNSGGPFKQWNKGIKLASGEFIWIAESDDYCDLDFLEKQIKILKEHSADIAVAETKKVKREKVYGRINHPIFNEKVKLKINNDYFLYCPILNVSAVLFKRSLIKHAENYSKYNLIGDRVFYFEAFQEKNIILNITTKSYFRKEGDSVSTLSSKDLTYLIEYYKEHQEFAWGALQTSRIDIKLYRKYIKRFFNRVNNRLSRLEKLNLTYAKLRWKYYQNLKLKQ